MSEHLYGYTTCRCGKERPRRKPDERLELADAWRRIEDGSLCRSCSMDIAKSRDECPECLTLDRGVSMCRLTWAHIGPCEPYDAISPELLAQLRSAEPREGTK